MFTTLLLLLAALLPNCTAANMRFIPTDTSVSAPPAHKRGVDITQVFHPTGGAGTDPVEQCDILTYTEVPHEGYHITLIDCNALLSDYEDVHGWFVLSDWDDGDANAMLWINGTCGLSISRHDGYTDDV